MRARLVLLLLALGAGLCCPAHSAGREGRPQAASLELYGTFEAMGLTITVGAGDDSDLDATAGVEYRVSGGGAYRSGLNLSRVSPTRFVGSLFWLEPGTAYDVRVTFDDPDGGPLDGAMVSGTASTRVEVAIPAAGCSYYASPLGSGTACSQAVPCALVEGLGQAQPGEQVMLLGGIYYEGEMVLPRSGTPGAPIVIRGQPGESAILDGADPVPFVWTAEGSGVSGMTKSPIPLWRPRSYGVTRNSRCSS